MVTLNVMVLMEGMVEDCTLRLHHGRTVSWPELVLLTHGVKVSTDFSLLGGHMYFLVTQSQMGNVQQLLSEEKLHIFKN